MEETIDIQTLPTTTIVENMGHQEQSYRAPPPPDKYGHGNQSIADFMRKPYLIQNGSTAGTGTTTSWTSSNAQGTLLGSAQGVAAMLTSNAQWANKIAGFNLLRGTVVFRLQINANPFQQGRLIMHFIPCYAERVAADASFASMHNTNVTNFTQHPNVELDCRDSYAELRIPYCTPSSHYDVKSGVYDWGNLYIHVLSQMRIGATATETTIDWALYAWFEDFELAAPLIAQGNFSKKRGRAGRLSTPEKEHVKAGGPITSIVGTGVKIAKALSGIPIIGPIADTAAWVGGAIESVAGFFGWSKPIHNVSPNITSSQQNRYLATSDGIDCAYPMALISGNATDITDRNSIRPEDEMSFNFLKTVPALTNTVNWADSAGAGHSLCSLLVGPQQTSNFALFYKTGSVTHNSHTAQVAFGPPIYYMSQLFSFWRGCVRLTIKMAKTEFHSGRLLITWTPGQAADVSPTIYTSYLSLREIVDIRTGDEFTIDLPYLCNTNYIPTNGYSGILDIQVLTELRHPENAAASIDLLFFVSGGEDFELQVPLQGTGCLATPISLQGGDEFEPRHDLLIDEVIAMEPCASLDTTHAQQSVGEFFSSCKQLLSRYTQVFQTSFGSSSTLLGVWPWFNGITYVVTSTGALSSAVAGADAYSILSQMYAFHRGSVKIAVVGSSLIGACTFTNDNTNRGSSACINNGAGADAGGQFSPVNWAAGVAGMAAVGASDSGPGPLTVLVPYYAQTKCSLNLNQTTSNTIPTELSQSISVLNIYSTAANLGAYCLLRAVSDEFQFSYFIGAPPIALSYS